MDQDLWSSVGSVLSDNLVHLGLDLEEAVQANTIAGLPAIANDAEKVCRRP